MEYQINGIWWFASIPLSETDLSLKLAVQDNVITGSYSVDAGVWVEIDQLDNFFAFDDVGIGVSNVDASQMDNDLVAQFEDFEIAQP